MRSPTGAMACAMLLALAACNEPVATPADPEVEMPGAAAAEADELLAHRSGRASSTVRWNRDASVVAYVLTRAGATRLAHATEQPAPTYRHRPIRLGTEWHHLIAVAAALHLAIQGGGLLLRLVQEEELRARAQRSRGSCATNSACLPEVIAVVRTRDRSVQHIPIEVLSHNYRGKRRRKKGLLDSTTVLAAIESSTARRAEAVLGRNVLVVDRPQ